MRETEGFAGPRVLAQKCSCFVCRIVSHGIPDTVSGMQKALNTADADHSESRLGLEGQNRVGEERVGMMLADVEKI